MTAPATSKERPPTPLEEDWIAAARALLVARGIAAVQVTTLAAALGVTRGGFYWRFRDRDDLLSQLLADWAERNTRSILTALGPPGSPRERYRRLVRLWIEEREFDPALDGAVRRWGGDDSAVALVVRAADEARIAALTQVFADAGQGATEAMVRARIVYFHQIGYYALDLHESRPRRDELVPMYDRILTGFDPSA